MSNSCPSKGRVTFTLDVLSDGSEFTGHGTLFLSAWKIPRHANSSSISWLEESMATSAPLGRYAIAGVGDLISRLAADQRFKLACTKAVFGCCPSSLDGFSALLLSLQSAGMPSLHCVSTNSDSMEELASIVVGSRRSFQLVNCQVPEGDTGTWWKVYTDEYLIAHVGRLDGSDRTKLTYLYSMLSGGIPQKTFAAIPPGSTESSRRLVEMMQTRDLPMICNDERSLKVDLIIALNCDEDVLKIVESMKVKFLCTRPANDKFNPAILTRAQNIIQGLHQQSPEFFPTLTATSSDTLEDTAPRYDTVLESGTSILLGPDDETVIDRRRTTGDRNAQDEWQSTIGSLKKFQQSHDQKAGIDSDENEIDLDDENDNEEGAASLRTESPSSTPSLYVLGTGCATPSAIRGASAHALCFPMPVATDDSKDDIVILDCGEGMCTMLSRYGPPNGLDNIIGVWISHAHLDHYGGLPTLIRAIDDRRKPASKRVNEHDDKRPKVSPSMDCPWIIAPPKVLRYLDLSLHSHHGRHKESGRQLFEPRLHHDPTNSSLGPWNQFQSIQVPHNCHPAYGLFLSWERGLNSTEEMSFCFSGDCRPSHALVRACRSLHRGTELFLLHEATFEDEEEDQALRKKHSTVSDALRVAKDMNASRVLLTHFSQRYISLQAIPLNDSSMGCSIPVALAMDGLRIPLG